MGNQHHRHVEPATQGADFPIKHLTRDPVHRREGFIQQQRRGLPRQRARDRHALLLAAGKFRRTPPLQPAQIDQRQQAPRLGGPFRARQVIERGPDIAQRRQVRKQPVGLKHHAHPALVRRQAQPRRGIQPDRAADADPRLFGAPQPGDRAQHGRLARTGMAHQRQKLAGFHPERQVERNRPRRPGHDLKRHQRSLRPTRRDSQKVSVMVASEIASSTADISAALAVSKLCTRS